MRGRAAALVRGAICGAVFMVLLLGACHPNPPPSPGPDAPPAPPIPAPAHVYSCAEACANRAKLGCKFQEGCTSRCEAVGDQAFTDCEATAASCSTITACDKGGGS